jgi:hypothetical protein
MKMAVFWVVAPFTLVEVYQRLRGPCCLHHQGDEYSSPFETLVNFYQTARRYNPEDSHLLTKYEHQTSANNKYCIAAIKFLSYL